MFLTVKAKSILISIVALVAVVGLCVTLTFASSPSSNVPKIGKTVVIDAGHGGADGGVVGKTSGVKESDINLAVAKKLEKALIENGYDVILTRENNDGLYKPSASNKKLSDMQARRDKINKIKPDLVLSIHQNSYPLSSVKGAQVFYPEQSAATAEQAGIMQNALNSVLGGARTQKSGDYYILNCTEYPSLIVECGFLSNAEEEALLVSAAYQDKLAYAIYNGIQGIFGLTESAQTVYPITYSNTSAT